MSASPLMSLGIKALAANYAALQTVGHNISNANVAGYSRQDVQLVTAQGQFTGAGFFGKGVDVATVQRRHDAFLTGEATRASSLSSLDGVRLQKLNQLETVFKTGEAGLGHAVSSFINSMGDLANRPGDSATRQVVLTRAADLSMRFAEAGQALDDIQAGVTADLQTSVTRINGLATNIAAANQRIAALKGLGQPANDLEDERDRLIGRLSEEVQVSRIEASDGTVGVFIAGGQRLVLGAEAAQLAVRPDPSDPRRAAVGVVAGPRVNLLDPSALGGGKVAGLLRFQNTDLVDGRNLAGRLAAEVGLAVNQQQQSGLNLSGSNPTPALFKLTQPQAIPNANNDAAGGRLSLQYTGEPGALQASDYDLREVEGSPGTWRMTRLVGGQLAVDPNDPNDGLDRITFTAPPAPGDPAPQLHGIRLIWGDPPPQPGDNFRLQTVGRAANDMATLLRDPRDLAAASPLVATAPVANAGTLQVDQLSMTSILPSLPGASETLSFARQNPPVVDADGKSYDFAVYSSLTGGPTFWNPGERLIGLNPDPAVGGSRYEILLSGVPADNDSLQIDPTPAGALSSNNGNARALLSLRDLGLIEGQPVTDGYAMALAEIGTRVQSGQATASISAAVSQQAEAQRSSQAGVNLDEEAARLIQFQQSYQAAAKMLQVAQSLFDTLLQTTGN